MVVTEKELFLSLNYSLNEALKGNIIVEINSFVFWTESKLSSKINIAWKNLYND